MHDCVFAAYCRCQRLSLKSHIDERTICLTTRNIGPLNYLLGRKKHIKRICTPRSKTHTSGFRNTKPAVMRTMSTRLRYAQSVSTLTATISGLPFLFTRSRWWLRRYRGSQVQPHGLCLARFIVELILSRSTQMQSYCSSLSFSLLRSRAATTPP